MAEAFEAAVDLTGLRAVAVEAAIENVVRRAAFVREPEILHRHEFGDGEAIVTSVSERSARGSFTPASA